MVHDRSVSNDNWSNPLVFFILFFVFAEFHYLSFRLSGVCLKDLKKKNTGKSLNLRVAQAGAIFSFDQLLGNFIPTRCVRMQQGEFLFQNIFCSGLWPTIIAEKEGGLVKKMEKHTTEKKITWMCFSFSSARFCISA